MTDVSEEMPGRSFTLGELANRLGAALKGDPDIKIDGVGTLENAFEGQLSFITHSRYTRLLNRCKASAFIVPPALESLDYPLLITAEPYLALAKASQLFSYPPPIERGVHPRAHIGKGVQLEEGVSVGPLSHIGSNCRIGRDTSIYGLSYLGCNVTVGEGCMIYPNVTILDGCRIGNRVVIHSGTVVGSDGFGYAQDEQGRHIKIPQVGSVQIDDDVEIGANCAIDRAAFDKTWIRQGTKIDNLVQIAHNVVVGEHSMIISQVGISGSTRLGKHVVLAGQVGIAGHLDIGDRARVGAKSGVHKSITAGEDMLGIPALPYKEWFKMYGNVQRLSRLKEELEELKAKVRSLEQSAAEDDHG